MYYAYFQQVSSWADKNRMKLEESHFVMSGEQVTVNAYLPPEQTDWDIVRGGDGKVLSLASQSVYMYLSAYMVYV